MTRMTCNKSSLRPLRQKLRRHVKMTVVFSQTEFIHGQFPFKSLEMAVDSSNSFGEKMCG